MHTLLESTNRDTHIENTPYTIESHREKEKSIKRTTIPI